MNQIEGGILYICATPIGNLEDASFRLIRTLKECDLIAAEDTRQTKKLLEHYQISTHATSYHEHNIKHKTQEIVSLLKSGKNIALVSDAGMPCISDPGYELVKEVSEDNIRIVVIPGPSAIVSGIAGSGLNSDRFVFEGFLPREGKMRRRILRKLVEEERTIVFYESPHRLLKSLKDIGDILGNRNICLAREMTKKFEEYYRGSVDSAIKEFSGREVLGEFTVIIEGKPEEVTTNVQV